MLLNVASLVENIYEVNCLRGIQLSQIIFAYVYVIFFTKSNIYLLLSN